MIDFFCSHLKNTETILSLWAVQKQTASHIQPIGHILLTLFYICYLFNVSFFLPTPCYPAYSYYSVSINISTTQYLLSTYSVLHLHQKDTKEKELLSQFLFIETLQVSQLKLMTKLRLGGFFWNSYVPTNPTIILNN